MSSSQIGVDGSCINIESPEEMETRHRKEVKSLEGEKRAALKKAKTLKGKKGRDALNRYG